MATRKKKQNRTGLKALMKLAAEPVPLGSGTTLHGSGLYQYMKTNAIDGSMRILRFKTAANVARAQAIGMAHDTPLGAAWESIH
ncbi:MAG: hypothetical protein AAF645_29995 [Myxococcota bacterium]